MHVLRTRLGQPNELTRVAVHFPAHLGTIAGDADRGTRFVRRSRPALIALLISGAAIVACAVLIAILAHRDHADGDRHGPRTPQPTATRRPGG